MALIDTQTFPLTKQRLATALALIPTQPDIFSASRMREARVAFICGKNVLSSIRGWLLAANVIKSDRSLYYLTDYGKQLADNDSSMENAGSWWSFHLSVCFSERCEPYRALFLVVGESTGFVLSDETLVAKLAIILGERPGSDVTSGTIGSNLAGVMKMFLGDSPLSDLGLMDIVPENGLRRLRLGEPGVPDYAIIHGIALARRQHFATRITIEFSELVAVGLHHFLTLSVTRLRNRLRELGRSSAWQQHFAFIEGQGLDSIQFGDLLSPKQTLLHLLQDAEDTWI